MNPIANQFNSPLIRRRTFRAFSLIELLVVISIIALLAALTVAGLHSISITKKVNTASAELQEISLAIENYHAKYGVYPPGNSANTSVGGLTNQLYYELTGTSLDAQGNIQSAGTNNISPNTFSQAFGVAGVMNSTRGNGEETHPSQNFLTGLRANRVGTIPVNGQGVNLLVTSVAGPDDAYSPAGSRGVNPFRYKAPDATNNNPGSYDLWIELSIANTNFNTPDAGGFKRYLISNWSKTTQKNSPMP